MIRAIPRLLLAPVGDLRPPLMDSTGFRFDLLCRRHLDPSLLRMGRAEDDAVPVSPEPEAETPVEVVQPQPPQQRTRGGLLGGLVDFAIGK